MKYLLIISIAVLFTCCSYHHSFEPWTPEKSEYYTMVNVDGVNIEKWINSTVNTKGGYNIGFKSYDVNSGTLYLYGFNRIPFNSGRHYLRVNWDSLSGISIYTETCCGMEDHPTSTLSELYASDSVNNYIELKFDTVTQEVWGMFKATYLTAPSVLMHVQCDTFYCKYTRF